MRGEVANMDWRFRWTSNTDVELSHIDRGVRMAKRYESLEKMGFALLLSPDFGLIKLFFNAIIIVGGTSGCMIGLLLVRVKQTFNKYLPAMVCQVQQNFVHFAHLEAFPMYKPVHLSFINPVH